MFTTVKVLKRFNVFRVQTASQISNVKFFLILVITRFFFLTPSVLKKKNGIFVRNFSLEIASRLWIFMQIHIFTNPLRKCAKFVSNFSYFFLSLSLIISKQTRKSKERSEKRNSLLLIAA